MVMSRCHIQGCSLLLAVTISFQLSIVSSETYAKQKRSVDVDTAINGPKFNTEHNKRYMMSSFKTDLGKRAIDEDDFEKRAFGFKSDLGKRDETIDGDDEYSKRAYGFRSDLGKRAYGFRSDLGKRAYGFRSDLGKRAYGFRSDLGKRGYGFRADLGKRTIDTSLDDLDTNTLQHLLEGNVNFKRAYGFRSDLGKRDQDKRGYGFRSDLGKRFYDALGSSDQLDRYSDDADRSVIDSHSHELSGDSGKRGYGFRADLGKRSASKDSQN